MLEIHVRFFSKGWGIQHSFSEHVMANISHVFYFYLCVIFVIHKHNKLKQKQCQNNANLGRIRGS